MADAVADQFIASVLLAPEHNRENTEAEDHPQGVATAAPLFDFRAEQLREGIAVDAFTCPACYEEVPACAGIFLAGAEGNDELAYSVVSEGESEADDTSRSGCEHHSLCRSCFERLATSAIERREPVSCPTCRKRVPGWLIRSALGAEVGVRHEAVESATLQQSDGIGRMWQCPMPDCTNRRVLPEGFDTDDNESKFHDEDEEEKGDDGDGFVLVDALRVVWCEVCRKKICVRCACEEHTDGTSCGDYQRWKEENDAGERSFAALKEEGLIKPCPNCAAPILKRAWTCNFVRCQSCQSPDGMCWATGKRRHGVNNCGGGHNCH